MSCALLHRVRSGLSLLTLGALVLGSVPAVAACIDDLKVVGATATYRTRLFQGRASRRDALVEVHLHSTATTAVSGLELAIFLGASMSAVQSTRASALPTQQARVFEDGGLAFRARVPVVLPAGGTRKLSIERRAVPMGVDLYGVTAVVVGCARLVPVGDVQLVLPRQSAGPSDWLLGGAFVLTVLIGLLVMRRLR